MPLLRWVLVFFFLAGYVGAESDEPRIIRIPPDPPRATAGRLESTSVNIHVHHAAPVARFPYYRPYSGFYRPFFRSYYRSGFDPYFRPHYLPYYLEPSPLAYPPSGFFGYPGVAPGYAGASRGIYRLIVDPPPTGGVVRVNTSDLVFNVTPARAMIFIDGKLIGSARDFATERDRYTLLDGEHLLRIEFPGYQPFETVLEVSPNRTLHLDIEMKPE
jgi:hypothetical protein